MRSRHRRLRMESLENRNLLAAVQIADISVRDTVERVAVPIEIDDATGVRAAEIRIDYDSKLFEVSPKNITAGSAWAGKAITLSNIDESAGAIVAFVFATEPVAGGSGSLIDVSFALRPNARPGETSIDLQEVRLNEGQVALQAVPVIGTDPTDGVITITREVSPRRTTSFVERPALTCSVDQFELGNPTTTDVIRFVPPHLFPSAIHDEPFWFRRSRTFIGPIADHLFATVDHWRVYR